MMTKTMLILLLVGFFLILYIGFRKIDRKLEALVRLNNIKQKKTTKKKRARPIQIRRACYASSPFDNTTREP